MLCILYVNAVGACLGIVALLFERVLPATWARRWLWCAAIALSVTLPGYYRGHHTSSVTEMWAQQASVDNPLKTISLTLLNPDRWALIQSYDTVIRPVWLTAAALLIVWGLVSAWQVSRVVRRSRKEPGNADGNAIVDSIPVVVTDSVGPATVGVFRSRVLVPRWVLALPAVQRQYVLRHEDEHRKANDARLLFIASLTLILLPWNIALWWQLRRLRLAVEMDCDNRVVSALGDATAYGTLLLKIAQLTNTGPRFQPALLGVGMLERRLTVLLAPTPLRHVQRFLLPVAASVLLFFVLSMPHPILAREHQAHVATSSPTSSVTHQMPQR